MIALLLSRHMRGGLAGAGTATVPWGHRSLVHPLPSREWNPPLYHLNQLHADRQPLQLSGALYMLYIYTPEIPIAIVLKFARFASICYVTAVILGFKDWFMS